MAASGWATLLGARWSVLALLVLAACGRSYADVVAAPADAERLVVALQRQGAIDWFIALLRDGPGESSSWIVVATDGTRLAAGDTVSGSLTVTPDGGAVLQCRSPAQMETIYGFVLAVPPSHEATLTLPCAPLLDARFPFTVTATLALTPGPETPTAAASRDP